MNHCSLHFGSSRSSCRNQELHSQGKTWCLISHWRRSLKVPKSAIFPHYFDSVSCRFLDRFRFWFSIFEFVVRKLHVCLICHQRKTPNIAQCWSDDVRGSGDDATRISIKGVKFFFPNKIWSVSANTVGAKEARYLRDVRGVLSAIRDGAGNKEAYFSQKRRPRRRWTNRDPMRGRSAWLMEWSRECINEFLDANAPDSLRGKNEKLLSPSDRWIIHVKKVRNSHYGTWDV